MFDVTKNNEPKQGLTPEQAAAMVESETARRWGLRDRGMLKPGYAADVVVFNPDTIGPDMPTVERDLPSGAKRLKQTAHGIKTTIVNGEIFLNSNEHTGSQSGQLLRGPLASNGST